MALAGRRHGTRKGELRGCDGARWLGWVQALRLGECGDV